MSLTESDGSELSGKDGLIAPVPRISIQAFCDSPPMVALVASASEDRRMHKASVKTLTGGIAAALSTFRQEQTPNVILLEAGADNAAFLAGLDALAEFCDDGTRVVVLGQANDINFYRALISRGVSEYLVAPIDVLGVVRAISGLYATPGKGTLGRIIAVYGAKGGVGASVVAHHIAWSISNSLGMASVIADLDLAFGTAALDFNLDPQQGIAEAVYAPDRLDSNMLDRLMSKCNEHLTLLSAPSTLSKNYDLDEFSFEGVIDLLRGSAPIVVLDVPHAWTAWTRRILLSADEVVLVASPDLANLRNVKNLLDVLGPARSNDGKSKLVMNMVGVPKRPEIAVKEFATAVNVDPTVVIPFEPKLFGTASNNGQMVAQVSGAAKLARLFDHLGRVVAAKPDLSKGKSGSLIDGLKSTKLSFEFGKKV